MKTSFFTTLKASSFVTIASLAAVVSVSAAFQTPQPSDATAVQVVTISAKPWSAEQKLAFDAEQAGTQTVVISAKRLTAEQKLAMDQEDKVIQTAQSVKDAKAAING